MTANREASFLILAVSVIVRRLDLGVFLACFIYIKLFGIGNVHKYLQLHTFTGRQSEYKQTDIQNLMHCSLNM